MSAALTVIATGAALTTVMTAPWQLTLLWGVLVGAGSGSLALAFAATVTNRWFSERRGLVAGLLTAASGTGQLVFLPLLAGVVDHAGWRPATALLAVAAVAVVPLALLFLHDHPADVGRKPYGAREFTPGPEPVPGAAGRTVRVLLDALRTGPFWLLAGTFAICGASTNGIMWTHFTPAAHDHGMPVTTAASLLAGVGVFNIAGTVASGWLTDRFDARRLLGVHYGLRGLTLLFLPLALAATVQPSMVVFVVLFGLLDLATVPPTITLCSRAYGGDGAIVFGWVNAAHQAGAALVAFLGGVTRDVSGSYDLVWVGAGSLCAVAALMALVVRVTPAGGQRPLSGLAKQRLSASKR